MRIEFLYWEACQSHESALARLQEVLEEERIDAELILVHVDSEEAAQALRFPGSPTIRVEGQDLFPESTGEGFSLTCRVYYIDDGRISPLPTTKMLRRALRHAVGTGPSPVPSS